MKTKTIDSTEYNHIEPMSNEEIDYFKNEENQEENTELNRHEFQTKLKKEERNIISLMKRIVYDVCTYGSYDPLKVFINALKNSKYLKNSIYKEYIIQEAKVYIDEDYMYIQFLRKVEEFFEEGDKRMI
jgi:hypothetical protein